MENKEIKKDDKSIQQNNDANIKPDAETIQKTDPQDNMQGPVSSLVNSAKKNIEKEGGNTPSDSDENKA